MGGVLGETVAVAAGVGVPALDRLGERQRRIEGEAGQALPLPHAADRQLRLAGQPFQAAEFVGGELALPFVADQKGRGDALVELQGSGGGGPVSHSQGDLAQAFVARVLEDVAGSGDAAVKDSPAGDAFTVGSAVGQQTQEVFLLEPVGGVGPLAAAGVGHHEAAKLGARELRHAVGDLPEHLRLIVSGHDGAVDDAQRLQLLLAYIVVGLHVQQVFYGVIELVALCLDICPLV